METLIDDSLTLARQGDPVTDTKPLAFETIAAQAWAVVQSDEATLMVEKDFTLQADPDRLQQLLENLFRNAIDHSNGAVSIHVGPLTEPTGFYVADDGPGIPESERRDIFEPGYSTDENGTGLGLAIVSEIVDAHGWDVTVTEGSEGGARFEINCRQEST
jgi:signal transduction histidine kinase